MKTFIKIILSLVLIAVLVLNILNLKSNMQLKKELRYIYNNIDVIDMNTNSIYDDVSEIKDDLYYIKRTVNDIEDALY